MRKYVVGITGGIATGKTNVTDALRHAGAIVIDADEISRSLTQEGGSALPVLLQHFGKAVFACADPAHLVLDRKALGKLIFSDTQKKALLEQLLHPLIIGETKFQLDRIPNGVVFVSAPLLFECGMEKMCDEVWCTYIPPEEQLNRLMQRDHLSREDALARIQSQMSAEEKKDKSTLVINTSGTREESAAQARLALSALQDRLK